MTVRIPETLRARIVAIASTLRRSQGDIVREILEREIPQVEWENRILERAKAVREGSATIITADELDEALGLVGVPVPVDALDYIS